MSLARAADVSYYGIIKLQEFTQGTNTTPTAITNGYSFNAFLIAASNNVVTNVTVRRAGTTVTNVLEPQDAGEALWRFQSRFATQSALDAAYPNGSIFSAVNYTMSMATVDDGAQSQNLSFATILTGYPPTPQIANLGAAQSIDTTREFVLKWNSLGGGSLDIVQLIISDVASNVVYATPAPFQPDALNGSSTSAAIPANVLPPGTALIGHLTIARPGLPNTSYATGIPAFSRDTEFPLLTRPAPAQPVLTISRAAGGVTIRFTTEPDRSYHLLGSSNLVAWSDLLVTNASAPAVQYDSQGVATNAMQFYRVQVGP